MVVVIQENRSFDNLFQGFPGADTVSYGYDSKGNKVQLQPVALEASYGLDHLSSDFFAACDGSPLGQNCKMDGFDKEGVYGSKIPKNPQYGYVPASETTLYFAIAQAYVLADKTFASNIDASFVSHQYQIAAQANSAVDLPQLAWGCSGGPTDTVVTLDADRSYGPREPACFNSRTIADELDAKKKTWRFYATASGGVSDDWSAYQAIKHIYDGRKWTQDVVNPPSQFLADVAAGNLANVTWITPTCADSDHADCLSNTGPQWVADVIDAVGQSPFWNSSAVFVIWDEWGGWYDHVAPPYADYDGLGMRVPMLIVSPYAKQGYVSHVQYESASIPRFIEDTFGLKRLAAADARAASPAGDAFDFTQPPRTFSPFASQSRERAFMRSLPDPRPPDDD